MHLFSDVSLIFKRREAMTSRSLVDLHPTLVKVWLQAEKRWGELYPNMAKPILTCTYRSKEEQNRLYAQGRTTKGKIVTRARGGESPHNYKPSFAFDIAFAVGNELDWRPILFSLFNGIVKEVSNEVVWGGDFKSFKDRPHFELKSYREL